MLTSGTSLLKGVCFYVTDIYTNSKAFSILTTTDIYIIQQGNIYDNIQTDLNELIK